MTLKLPFEINLLPEQVDSCGSSRHRWTDQFQASSVRSVSLENLCNSFHTSDLLLEHSQRLRQNTITTGTKRAGNGPNV